MPRAAGAANVQRSTPNVQLALCGIEAFGVERCCGTFAEYLSHFRLSNVQQRWPSAALQIICIRGGRRLSVLLGTARLRRLRFHFDLGRGEAVAATSRRLYHGASMRYKVP